MESGGDPSVWISTVLLMAGEIGVSDYSRLLSTDGAGSRGITISSGIDVVIRISA